MHSSVKREMPEGMEEHRDCECRVVGFCLVTISEKKLPRCCKWRKTKAYGAVYYHVYLTKQ